MILAVTLKNNITDLSKVILNGRKMTDESMNILYIHISCIGHMILELAR